MRFKILIEVKDQLVLIDYIYFLQPLFQVEDIIQKLLLDSLK